RRGIRSVPVIIRGEKINMAQSLADIATFVGKTLNHTRLPVAELMERWRYVLVTARGLIAQIPQERLEQPAYPGRQQRALCELTYHIFQIPDAFLQAVQHGLKDTRDVSDAIFDHLKTVSDVLGYADSVIERLDTWWADQHDKTCAFRIETYYGEQDAEQVIERNTWHTAQHARQLDSVVGAEMSNAHGRIDPTKFDGLPMPQALWQ
ncbi:hypothetical protein PQQ51_25390, partial [Paraburkholderia xenovorans]|uniref:hypothetical protein n=1 Tax=Paraburkholderia xenovorans TaxID=36873 RepID=UPI0038B8761E